jgi:hypothetical protein
VLDEKVLKDSVKVVSPWDFLLWPHNNKELGPEVSTAEANYMYMVIGCRTE